MLSTSLSRRAILRGGVAVGAVCGLIAPASLFAQSPAAQPYRWTSVPFGAGGFVDGFLYHPKEKDLLYARTDIGGLYRFDYAAQRWIPLLDQLGHDDSDLMGVLSMAVDPNDSNRLYAACGLYLADWAHTGAILRSADRGQSWQKTPLSIRVGGNADGRGAGDRLLVDPANPQLLYFGSNQDGLWKSRDGGASFSKASASPSSSLTFVRSEPKTGALYVGSAAGENGLFVSHDQGESFQLVEGPPRQPPQHAAFAADGSLYVTFAQSDDGFAANPSHAVRGSVWKRDGAGGAWRDISPIHPDNNPRGGYSAVDVGPDGLVAVSTIERWWPGDDIFVSKDGGGQWTALSTASQHNAGAYPWIAETQQSPSRMGSWMSDLRINPFNPDEMIYGTGGGLWISRNLTAVGSGQPVVFDAKIDNLEETAIIQMVSPTGGATLLAAMGDVAGGAWDDLTKSPKVGLFRPNTETNYSIDYAGQAPAHLVRTVNNSGTHGFYSDDGGVGWTAFPTSPYHPPGEHEAWHGPGQAVISAKGSHLLWVPDKDTAYFSADQGQNWAPSANWPSNRDQPLIPLSDKVVNGVFYVFDRGGGRILISTNGGASFVPIATGLPAVQGWEQAELAVVPTRMRDLWLALPAGLIHSRDSQSPFTEVKNVDAAWAIGFGAAASKDGYPVVFLSGKIKGEEGIWRSEDEGQSWVRINDESHQFGAIGAITGDPLQYGVVYIAPHGRGILAGRPA